MSVSTLPAWFHTRRPLLRRLVWTTVLGYALILLVMYFGQEWMVLPGRRSQGWSAARVTPPPGTELARLQTANGDPFVALFAPALQADGRPHPEAARQPTLLLFYGTGSWLQTMAPIIEKLRREGVNVLTPEYVGYGMSGGSACEAGCYATADAAYDYLLTRADIDPKRLVIAGVSLGGAVAMDLASRRPASGLVTFCTFTSMPAMAAIKHPYVPAQWLLHQRFNSRAKIGKIRCPILMFHGNRDPLVPYSMMSDLAKAATVPVTAVDINGGDHEFLAAPWRDPLPSALQRFLQSLDNPIAPQPGGVIRPRTISPALAPSG